MRPDRAQGNEWMRSASTGDTEAFGKLAGAMQDELYRLALACGLGRADAAEAAQETLLRAYRRRKSWRSDGDAAAWIYGIAMNVAREFRRKRRRGAMIGLDGGAVAAEPPSDDRAGPVDIAALAGALDALPPRQREAIACRYLRGLSVRDTAAAMACAEGTVKAAVAAALANLRRSLREGP